MEVWKSFVMGFQTIISGFASFSAWFTTPLVNINGVEVTPFLIIAPSTLVVIVTILAARFVVGS